MRRLRVVLGLVLAAGCALKGDVRKVELQVQDTRAALARLDSARGADRDSLLVVIGALERSVAAQQTLLSQMRGELRTELQSVRQDLALLQELTGQSQQRLSELRTRLGFPAAPRPAPDTGTSVPVGPSGNPTGPTAEQMYDVSLQQYRRGSMTTARAGFRELLRVYPTDERAADALFYIGESWARENADSAAAVYQQVVTRYPTSPHAPASLYKLGLLAEQRGDRAAARGHYSRLIAGYPRSDEANLARDKLQRLGQ